MAHLLLTWSSEETAARRRVVERAKTKRLVLELQENGTPAARVSSGFDIGGVGGMIEDVWW